MNLHPGPPAISSPLEAAILFVRFLKFEFIVAKICVASVLATYLKCVLLRIPPIPRIVRFMEIRGVVVHGKKQARGLGYPTANIAYTSTEHVKHGVWTCWLEIDGEKHESLGIVGMWQLETGEPSIEAYALSLDRGMYDKDVAIIFGEWLRPLEQFKTTALLREQIEKDIARARTWFAAQK
jgi:hypothetical protein